MSKIVLYPTEETGAEIRRQAQKAGVSVNAFLLTFVNMVANGSLKLEPYIAPPKK